VKDLMEDLDTLYKSINLATKDATNFNDDSRF